MSVSQTKDQEPEATPSRVLAVADWSIDPGDVARSLRAEGGPGAAIGLLVPSGLTALQWIGDPYASRPCAERQLEAIRRLSRSQRTEIGFAAVGDPERVPTITEALDKWPAERVILFERRRRLPAPFRWGVAARIERRHGIRVERVPVSSQSRWTALRPPWRRAPRCRPALATGD